jgi:DNA repair protein RadC
MNITLTDKEKIKIMNSDDLYKIMQQILLREQRVDQDREHFWTVCLNRANVIMNIELVSMGNVFSTGVLPMEVFSIPLQKRTVSLIMVHNHPSGELNPSKADKDVTDRIIQVGKFVDIPVLDHMIISDKSYYSFSDSGVLAELELSLKYVPVYMQKDKALNEQRKEFEKATKVISSKSEKRGIKEGLKQKAEEMARMMKEKGYPVEEIVQLTGLSKTAIGKIVVD